MKRSWQPTKLNDVLRQVAREEVVEPAKNYRLLGVRLDGGGPFLREEKPGSQISANKLMRVSAGDFIYSRLFAWRGAFGLIEQNLDGCYVSGEFPTFIADHDRIDTRFLKLWLQLPETLRTVEAKCSGSTPLTRNRFKERFFLGLEIPLPPLAEQQRIVARIDALAARIEEAKGLRAQAMGEVEAVMGAAKNRVLQSGDSSQWPSTNLGAIADIQSGTTLGRKLSGHTIQLPYLRVANVQDGYLDLGQIKTVEVLESERSKWQLLPGDILMTEGGDWDKLGRGAIWSGEIPDCIHQNHIFRLRIDAKQFDHRFVLALISSPSGKAYFQAASKQTTNLATINQRQLRAFPIAHPPLSEQRRIVAHLDDLQAKVEAVKRLQAETQAELAALLPAVLARAFRGGVVAHGNEEKAGHIRSARRGARRHHEQSPRLWHPPRAGLVSHSCRVGAQALAAAMARLLSDTGLW